MQKFSIAALFVSALAGNEASTTDASGVVRLSVRRAWTTGI